MRGTFADQKEALHPWTGLRVGYPQDGDDDVIHDATQTVVADGDFFLSATIRELDGLGDWLSSENSDTPPLASVEEQLEKLEPDERLELCCLQAGKLCSCVRNQAELLQHIDSLIKTGVELLGIPKQDLVRHVQRITVLQRSLSFEA